MFAIGLVNHQPVVFFLVLWGSWFYSCQNPMAFLMASGEGEVWPTSPSFVWPKQMETLYIYYDIPYKWKHIIY